MRKANCTRFQLVGNSDRFEWKVTGKYQENCLMRKIKMQEEKIKVYTYTRVSTAMQIDGYSLDAQRARMKAYADFNDYEIVGEYEDAGKSGKSIEGRTQFN